MSGLNKVIIMGRLGQDPELKFTPSGTSVCNFSVATSENWTDKSGQKQERTEWHCFVAWGKLGEICGKHLKKGKQALFEGKLQTREWEDKSGNKRYTTEINAISMQFCGDNINNSEAKTPEVVGKEETRDYGQPDFAPDDLSIPF